MRNSLLPLSFILIGSSLSIAPAAQPTAGSYLKDGKLKERIEVRELQGGFAGFTGTYYEIEPDGSWATGPVLPPQSRRGDPTAKGKLTADQLAQLAKEFARLDLANLPSHGESVTNPKIMRVYFGTRMVELQPNPGKASPEQDKAIRARYDGIFQAVKAACK